MTGILAVFVWFISSFASGPDFGGYIDTYQSIGLKSPQRFMGSRTRLRFESNCALGSAWAYASLNAVYNRIVKDETGLHLREAFIAWAGNYFDFKVGNQIIIWGQSEGLGVTDNVSPKDYSEALARDFDDMRIPVAAFKGRVLLDKVTLELVWLPVFVPAVISYTQPGSNTDNPWAMTLPEGIPVHETVQPAIKLKNSEAGGRILLNTSIMDISISGLYTWNDVPTMHPEPDGLHPRHHRLIVWGIDVSFPVSVLVIRGEAALNDGVYFTTRQGIPEEKRALAGLMGVDITPGSDWSISVQFYDQYILDYESALTTPGHMMHTTLRISKELFRNTLNCSAMAFYGIEYEELYGRVSVSYALTDAVKIGGGVHLFYGDEGMFGAYSDNSAGYIECTYTF
jgi:hypothetical protein